MHRAFDSSLHRVNVGESQVARLEGQRAALEAELREVSNDTAETDGLRSELDAAQKAMEAAEASAAALEAELKVCHYNVLNPMHSRWQVINPLRSLRLGAQPRCRIDQHAGCGWYNDGSAEGHNRREQPSRM